MSEENMDYIKRHIKDFILKASNSFPVVILTGARQIGKTTLFEHIKDTDRKIVSLDNPILRKNAKEDPEKFLQVYSPPVLIDEVQYAPELFPYIKILVDKNKRNGDFWLTGSQSFTMMKNVSESLAGRVAIIPMCNLSYAEIENYDLIPFDFDIKNLIKNKDKRKDINVAEIFNYIYRGFFPRVLVEKDIDVNLFYSSYIDTYISRDLRFLNKIENETSFINFLKIVACRTATNVNYEAMANECNITSPTAKAWLSLLVSSGIVLLIEPYLSNMLKRVVKSPRMYMADTGLLCNLMGWDNPIVTENSYMSGAIFETYVVNEIYKNFINRGIRPNLYFYRNNSKEEIDLIIEKNQIIHPIEIKKSANPKNPLKNFKSIEGNIGEGFVICLCNEIVPISKKDYLIPVNLI